MGSGATSGMDCCVTFALDSGTTFAMDSDATYEICCVPTSNMELGDYKFYFIIKLLFFNWGLGLKF